MKTINYVSYNVGDYVSISNLSGIYKIREYSYIGQKLQMVLVDDKKKRYVVTRTSAEIHKHKIKPKYDDLFDEILDEL